MKIFSIINQKGGVGKTTTTLNLAAALAAVGKRILLVDLDPQSNASTGLGLKGSGKTIYEALLGLCRIEEAVLPTFLPTLSVVPSFANLSGAEIELVPLLEREKKLKTALAPLEGQYDYCFIDCPPSLGLLTLNALTAATSVLIPVQCEFYALDGLGRLLSTLKRMRLSLNPHLDMGGIIMTMFDKRCVLNRQVVEEVRTVLKEHVFPLLIPRSIRISEAASHGKPVLFYDAKCSVSLAYIELARLFLEKEELSSQRRFT